MKPKTFPTVSALVKEIKEDWTNPVSKSPKKKAKDYAVSINAKKTSR